MTRALFAVVVAVAAWAPLPAADPPRPVVGDLVAVDFVHRTGQFRPADSGALTDFTLLPDADVRHLGAEADLRDLPVGSAVAVTFAPDAPGRPNRVASLCDQPPAGTPPDEIAADKQRQKHAAFLKDRGLPARVDRTAGQTLSLTLFGDPATFAAAWAKDFVAGREVKVAVANDELRTWNPVNDNERGKVLGVTPGKDGGPVRLVASVPYMLEGFRRGRVVRVFGAGWPAKDQPFGEQLFHYGAAAFPPELAECPPKEYPDQFPFRTDFGNAHLPWFRLVPGTAPPRFSDHRVWGELVSADADGRGGRFRPDGTRDEVAFTVTPTATVKHLNAIAGLSAVPPGTRCRFGLYQDATGAFRRADAVSDEVSDMMQNGMAWRVESVGADGTVIAARRPPAVKNYNGDMEQPPDVGRAELRVGPSTRVWTGDKRVPPADLAAGDLLVVNRTGDRPGRPSACTDVWVGRGTHQRFAAPPPKKAPR